MKILISSYVFHPSVGGIETVSAILAHEFINQGHEIKLITQTLTTDSKNFPFEVIRQPEKRQLFQLVNWCNVFFIIILVYKRYGHYFCSANHW